MPITKTDVEKLEANSILWDTGRGSVAGFGVRRQRVHPVFFLKYSDAGRQRWHSIGKFGSPWTTDLARAEAKRLLGQLAGGESPAARRLAAKPSSGIEDPALESAAAAMTMAELCDRYMVAARSGAILTRFNRPKKASTLDIDEGRISRHIKPLLGSSTVVSIDARAVKGLISDITTGKTAAVVKTKLRGRARVTGGPSTAARVADLLSGIMTWALDEEIIERNPVHRVRRARSQPKERFLNGEELARLGAVLDAGVDATGKVIHPHAISVAKLLCLTGCRIGEISKLQWSEVDFEEKCLRLEDTKTGRSLRPVANAAREVLRRQGRLVDTPFVFPGSRGGGAYQGVKKQIDRIFETAKIDRATPHTLRHTFASVASGLGYSDGTIGGLLGHKGRGITSRYVHRPDQAIASAAEAVCAAVLGSLRLSTEKPMPSPDEESIVAFNNGGGRLAGGSQL